MAELYLVQEEDLDRIAVERCLQGDVDAFGTLVERYQRPVFNTVLHMVGDAEDAREVCQQAFMKAFEHLSSYDPERKFFSWLYRVAVNESINHLKAKRPHDPLDETFEHPRPNPAQHFEELEEWTHLHAAIMDLESTLGGIERTARLSAELRRLARGVFPPIIGHSSARRFRRRRLSSNRFSSLLFSVPLSSARLSSLTSWLRASLRRSSWLASSRISL